MRRVIHKVHTVRVKKSRVVPQRRGRRAIAFRMNEGGCCRRLVLRGLLAGSRLGGCGDGGRGAVSQLIDLIDHLLLGVVLGMQRQIGANRVVDQLDKLGGAVG